jgi:hypothetical protein
MPENKTVKFSLCSLLLVAALTACTVESPPVKGFILPQGDVALGEQVFIKYGCYGCHAIPGVDLPILDPTPDLILEIGGEVYRVKNEGELLTAVINPTHVISPEFIAQLEEAGMGENSPMPYYGDVMTVSEMIDLVAFLKVQYVKLMPDFFESYAPEIK